MDTDLRSLYNEYLAGGNASADTFPAWLEMADVDFGSISESEWMEFLAAEGLSEDEAMQYLETLAEWGGHSDSEYDAFPEIDR